MSDLKANTASAPSTAPAPTAADTQIVSPAANLASLPTATPALTPTPTTQPPQSAPLSAPLSAPQSAPLPSTEAEVAKTLQQAETAAQVAAAAAQQAADAAANVAALASALTSDTPLNPELTPPHEPPASAFAISGLSYNSNDAQVESELEHQELDGGTAAAHSPAASPAAAPTMVTDESAWANLQTAHQDAGGALESEVGDDHLVLRGNPASRGIAMGRISFLQRSAQPSAKQSVEDVEAEVARFEQARSIAIAQLASLYEATVEKLGEQNAVVFQIHQMMLDDPDYVEAIESTIREEQANAEYAVDVTGARFAEMFSKMDNDYMQGRAADVVDVSRRLGDILSNGTRLKGPYPLNSKEPIILATDDLAPSETVQLDQDMVRAILTSEGSSRSHTVIFARTLGLPAVINIGPALKNELEGKMAIVDGGAGVVIIDPDEKTIATYTERKRTEDALRARLEQFRGKETRTLSGRKINLYANIGAVSDLDLVKSSDAEGIGLFRSEYIYLSSQDYPSEETQYEIYKETLQGMEGKKVVIRTLDIGADKTADYFMLKPEENPAMGMRAVRICLSRPEVFKTQLRALYRASVYGTLAIMFPMISSVEEVKECRRLCDEVKAELKAEGKEYSDQVELGIMIETPASAIISDLLAEHVDFFSIGTNDLTQFTLAVDRQNAEVGRFLNPYHRAVIRLIEMTVKNAHEHGIWVGVCGELAADEGFTQELIRIGVDEISVVPSSILMLRARISTLG